MATNTELLGLTLSDYDDYADISVINTNMTMVEKAMWARSRVWNLLDNSDFRNPVNQREGASYTGAEYGIDRWTGGNDTSSVTVTDQGIKFTANGSWNMIYQYFDAGQLGGKTLTFAACTSEGNLIVGSGVYPTDRGETLIVADVDAETGLQLMFDTRHTYDGVRICLANTAALDVTVAWAVLYPGAYTAETLPAYQPKGYATELLECQRYFYPVPSQYNMSYPAYAGSAQEARVTIQTPVPMRVTPSVSVVDATQIGVGASTAMKSATGLTVLSRDGNGVALSVATTGLTGFGQPCIVRFVTKVTLSADF